MSERRIWIVIVASIIAFVTAFTLCGVLWWGPILDHRSDTRNQRRIEHCQALHGTITLDRDGFMTTCTIGSGKGE